MMVEMKSRQWLIAGALLAAAIAAVVIWQRWPKNELGDGFASGNGRIEATEFDIATKQAGRIAKVLVAEGDMVTAGQLLVEMDSAELATDLRQAEAELRQAREDKNQALAVVTQRESDIRQARAAVSQRESEIKQVRAAIAQRESELALAQKEYNRAQALIEKDFISREQFDQEFSRSKSAAAALAQEQARQQAAEAALASELARQQSADAVLKGAQVQIAQRDAAIDASLARIEKIKTLIADGMLKSPIAGRVLYRLAEPGEVLAAGGKVLTVLELTDVYMTIFLPTALAGRIAVGSEARIILDAVPQYVIPASVSFVAARSQFTPKEVETKSEREKLMFRLKVKIDPDLLKKHIEKVRTGLPGVAYVRLDSAAPWPDHLHVKLPS